MRQVLFVIVVVGAAFAGGAVVNGPGFEWAQKRLLIYMGLQDGGEIASIDLPPAPGSAPVPAAAAAAEAPPSTEVKTATTEKAAEPPPVDPDARPAAFERQALSQGIPAPKAEPQATEPFVPTAPTPGAGEGPTKTPDPKPAPETAPAPLDPSVAPALLASLGTTPTTPTPTPTPESTPAPAPAAGDDSTAWTALRAKLGELGVTRYTIEGEPGGRVVFVCLIPLAGKQAVCQRFEAEGDDEFQAARAALRRITLWRASQAGPGK